ncbi:Phosphorylated carbohydrates phosphatase TM_1254 [uncultured Ruminococcus sp.]|nr:Phosphorylated carbohydrates phosphatase TM_1254 [uncultured Ruminococcus sp.]
MMNFVWKAYENDKILLIKAFVEFSAGAFLLQEEFMQRKEENFKAAIFDLDGTILDSMYVWEWIDQEFLTKRGIPVPDDYIEAVCARSFQEAADYTIARFGLQERAEDIIEEWGELAYQQYSEQVKLKPYAKEYLTFLKEQGIRLAVATGLSHALMEAVLKNNQIWDLFDLFCSADEVERGKEYPDLYFYTADKLSLAPEECIMFEDVYPGIRSAKMAGMIVYGVEDFYSLEQKERIIEIADGYLKDFRLAPVPKESGQ